MIEKRTHEDRDRDKMVLEIRMSISDLEIKN
jgi:hypothetical protein